MDSSKDELFKGFNLLDESWFIEDDFNDDDKEDMNNDIKDKILIFHQWVVLIKKYKKKMKKKIIKFIN